MKTRSTTDAKQAQALDLWKKGTMTQEEIATTVGCDPKTLRNWAKKGNWENLTILNQVTRPALYQKTLLMLAKVLDEVGDGTPNKVQNDSMSILSKQLEVLGGDKPVIVQLEVLNGFLEFIAKNHPKELPNYSLLVTQYTNSL